MYKYIYMYTKLIVINISKRKNTDSFLIVLFIKL